MKQSITIIEPVEGRKNILDHPLVFEDLNLKIVEFYSEEISPNTFVLTVSIEVKDTKKFATNHFLFIHAFDFNSTGDLDFLNYDTNQTIVEGNTIVFKRQISTDIYDYEEFRFGLIDRNAKYRYFVRALKNVSIKD